MDKYPKVVRNKQTQDKEIHSSQNQLHNLGVSVGFGFGPGSAEPTKGGNLDAEFCGGIQSARGGGSVLPSTVRSEMESTIGSNFGQVRLHTDDQADRLSQKISAKAFTVGSDVFFSKGAFSPHTAEGRQTLKHELTHVVQQGGRTTPNLRLGPVDDSHEREANQISRTESRPAATQANAGTVQRVFWPWQKQKTQKLGGSFNTVYRVQHRGGEVGYFKPNSDADPTMGARSLLTSGVDQALGLNAVARDTAQTIDGHQGIESEQAAGSATQKTLFEHEISRDQYRKARRYDDVDETNHWTTRSGPFWNRKKHYFRANQDGTTEELSRKDYRAETINPDELAKYKKEKTGPWWNRKTKYSSVTRSQYNRHNYDNPETQRGLANLQLEDAITGQSDRHGANIMVDDASGRAVGIDNDLMDSASPRFNPTIGGLHKPATGAMTPEQQSRRLATRKEMMNRVNFRTMSGKQVGLPSHVDLAAAQQIRGKKSRQFMADVQASMGDQWDTLSSEHKQQIRDRYSAVRRYVKAGMAAQGLEPDAAKAAKYTSPDYQAVVTGGAGRLPKIVGNWDRSTYDEQMAAKLTGSYSSSYLQRAVTDYNRARAGGDQMTVDDRGPAPLPVPAPPAEAAAPLAPASAPIAPLAPAAPAAPLAAASPATSAAPLDTASPAEPPPPAVEPPVESAPATTGGSIKDRIDFFNQVAASQ